MNIDLLKTQKYLEWMKHKIYLDKVSNDAKNRKVQRGQVYWCNFGMNIGSEMSKETVRPCVIIQNNIANINSSNTIVAPITHDKDKLPCLVQINTVTDKNNRIILDGQVNVSNIVCVSKARLEDFILKLTKQEIKAIDKAISTQLNLYIYYNNLSTKLEDKLLYIDKIKKARNTAQDKLTEIDKILKLPNEDNVKIKKIIKILDKN